MEVFAIVSHSLELLKSLVSVNVLNSRSCYVNIEWTQEIENICLLHNIGMYKAV